MKILKQGMLPKKDLKTFIFSCNECGCVFEATMDEINNTKSFLNILCAIENDPSRYVPCPCCGKSVEVLIDEKEANDE